MTLKNYRDTWMAKAASEEDGVATLDAKEVIKALRTVADAMEQAPHVYADDGPYRYALYRFGKLCRYSNMSVKQ